MAGQPTTTGPCSVKSGLCEHGKTKLGLPEPYRSLDCLSSAGKSQKEGIGSAAGCYTKGTGYRHSSAGENRGLTQLSKGIWSLPQRNRRERGHQQLSRRNRFPAAQQEGLLLFVIFNCSNKVSMV